MARAMASEREINYRNTPNRKRKTEERKSKETKTKRREKRLIQKAYVQEERNEPTIAVEMV